MFYSLRCLLSQQRRQWCRSAQAMGCTTQLYTAHIHAPPQRTGVSKIEVKQRDEVVWNRWTRLPCEEITAAGIVAERKRQEMHIAVEIRHEAATGWSNLTNRFWTPSSKQWMMGTRSPSVKAGLLAKDLLGLQRCLLTQFKCVASQDTHQPRATPALRSCVCTALTDVAEFKEGRQEQPSSGHQMTAPEQTVLALWRRCLCIDSS